MKPSTLKAAVRTASVPSHLHRRPVDPGHVNNWEAALARDRAGQLPKWMIDKGGTEFEHVLRAAGVGIKDAAANEQVRQWVMHNHRSKFVPLKILEALGIKAEDTL